MDSGLGACVVGDCRSAEPSVDAGRVARGVGWHSESAAWKSESASRHRRRRPLLERAACASVSSGQLQPRRRWHWPWQRRGKANSKRTVPAVDTATPEPPLQQAMAAPAAKPARSSSLAAGLSGAMSGMLIGASLQPLDVLRTRMQGDAAQGILRSAPQTLLHILRTQGLPGLWIGIGPSVVRLGAGVGLHMCLVENLAAALSRPLPAAGGGGWHIPPLSAALASGSSRALSSVLLCPLAVAKTRMEYAGPGAVRYRDTLDALATIARSEGPQALFRGLLPTIVTNAPFSGLYYMFYIRLKEQLSDEHRPKVLVNLSSGVLAAIAATVLTQPFDVLRTRLQLSRSVAGASGRGLAAEMVNALQSTLKQGVGSLFVGTWPRVLKRTAQTALVWTLYEELAPRLTALLLGARMVMLARVQQLQLH